MTLANIEVFLQTLLPMLEGQDALVEMISCFEQIDQSMILKFSFKPFFHVGRPGCIGGNDVML
jgi:hypothetical protein